jgi:hypothetical protein
VDGHCVAEPPRQVPSKIRLRLESVNAAGVLPRGLDIASVIRANVEEILSRPAEIGHEMELDLAVTAIIPRVTPILNRRGQHRLQRAFGFLNDHGLSTLSVIACCTTLQLCGSSTLYRMMRLQCERIVALGHHGLITCSERAWALLMRCLEFGRLFSWNAFWQNPFAVWLGGSHWRRRKDRT